MEFDEPWAQEGAKPPEAEATDGAPTEATAPAEPESAVA